MKNALKLGLFSISFLATMVVNASEKLNVKVAATSKMLAIELTNVVDGETLVIKDLDGEVLFYERLGETNEYSKVFSFNTLPQGLYFVESKEISKVQITPVVINDKGVALVENSSKTYLAPEVSLDGEVLKVMVRNYEKVPVSIAIYDNSGALLSKTEGNNNTLVFGSYRTSSLETKKLILSVSEGDYSFVKEIEL